MKQVGKGLLPRAAWAIDGVSEFMGYLSGVAIVAASAIMVEMVVARKLFNVSTSWQEEMARYLLILATFLAAAYTQKHEGHVGIDLVTYYVPPKPRALIHVIGSVAGLIVAIVLTWYSWPIWWEAVKFNYHSESLWGPHLAFPYILIPLGMSLLALQYLVYIGRKIVLLRDLRRGAKAPPAPEPPCYHEPQSGAAKTGNGGQA